MGRSEDLNERIGKLREQFVRVPLDKKEIADDPIHQLKQWMKEAVDAEVMEPNAMTLASADEKGRPSTRVVLIRELREEGPVFFTNYESRKGKELAVNPNVCGNLFWPELQRQVRLEGKAERISPEASDAYFHSRPLKSRIGAWASEQSQVVGSRRELEERFQKLETETPEIGPARPEYWGGYKILIERIEFWQGRPDRLHDRIELVLRSGGWQKQRLNP
ncbi:MAG: pyridoxamine 5'-phosphate oxidase [Flavobacteriales bacterium]